jgi:methylmalonyl-CoA mutase C-terminal domain/subunit
MATADPASAGSAAARPIRIVLAKAGMDGHDRGVKVVARILRDAGFEVIYTGLYQTPESIVSTAAQEDADAIGLSVLSAAHKHLFSETARVMREAGLDDVILFGGGIIPQKDIPWLEEHGVTRIFLPGTTGPDIVEFVRTAVKQRRRLSS